MNKNNQATKQADYREGCSTPRALSTDQEIHSGAEHTPAPPADRRVTPPANQICQGAEHTPATQTSLTGTPNHCEIESTVTTPSKRSITGISIRVNPDRRQREEDLRQQHTMNRVLPQDHVTVRAVNNQNIPSCAFLKNLPGCGIPQSTGDKHSLLCGPAKKRTTKQPHNQHVLPSRNPEVQSVSGTRGWRVERTTFQTSARARVPRSELHSKQVLEGDFSDQELADEPGKPQRCTRRKTGFKMQSTLFTTLPKKCHTCDQIALATGERYLEMQKTPAVQPLTELTKFTLCKRWNAQTRLLFFLLLHLRHRRVTPPAIWDCKGAEHTPCSDLPYQLPRLAGK